MQFAWAPAETAEIGGPWLDEIEEACGGRVNFEWYSAGELVPDDQVLPAIQNGTLDFAQCVSVGVNAPVDIVELCCVVPFGWRSASEFLTMWEYRGLKEIHEEAYGEIPDTKYLGTACHDPHNLLSREPVTSIEDFQGMKINSFEPFCRPYLKAGATIINVPVEEYYLAGQTGVVDSMLWCGTLEAYNNSWYEVFPYALYPQLNGNAECFYMANEEMWNSLPSDIQAIISQAVNKMAYTIWLYYYEGECRCSQYYTPTTLPDEDMEILRQYQWEWLDEVAQTSPRNARIVEILKAYNDEVEAANWFR